jgi:hypothetical protein
MSRLDSFIRRLEAQRACLNQAARLIATVPGPILEFGLGNGRTYDHLRAIMADREIWVFERTIAPHPDCMPPEDRLILGDFRDTVDDALQRIGTTAAFAHLDVGSGFVQETRALAAFLAPRVDRLMSEGGLVASDQPLSAPGWDPVPIKGVEPGRYHLYRVTRRARR